MLDDTIYACLTKHPTVDNIINEHGDGTLRSFIPARAAF